MKYMKKLITLLAALTLALAMAVPAFAASSTGTITIDNAVTGTTYKAYRIFDLESYDTDKNAYSYKLNTKWNDFSTYSTTIDSNTVSAADFFSVNSAGYIEWKDAKKDAGADFAKLAKAFVDEKNIEWDRTETASSTTVTFTDLTLGYYLVDTSLGSLCSLDTTTPSVTIKEKNSDTTIEKKIVITGNEKVDSNSAGIGDTVNFSITITVKDGAPKNYVLHDKLSGLTFDPNSLEVKVGTETLTANTDYTLETNPKDGDSFDVKFTDGKLKTNDVVVVTYSATVAADATIAGAGNKNTAKLVYNGKDSTKEETTTYVWKLNVHKYALNSTNDEVALSGAKFVLYRMDSGVKKYAKLTGDKIDDWVTDKGDATTLETDGAGNILIEGLNVGTYYLEETEAPAGYNKLTEPIEVEITATTSVTSGSETVQYKNSSETSYTPATDATVKVLNNAGTQLPSTGGIGTTLFYVIGGVLMAVAAVLLVTKKRMNNK
ncbi:SpaH/EbpB family LPXTG-anchored major pilin [Oscillospiraceae bacterium SCCA1]|nr:SpaH/EbpB family LPXTG-anchored major pilin [Oscillospiraceae bacterium SCCA1]